MPTLVSQTWDGVTPPAIPAGWTADSGIESLASGTAHSAPNETRNTNTSSGRNIYYSSAQDGNSGDVRAQIYARTTTSSSNHSVQVGTRIQSTPYSTCYSAAMIWNGQVQLFRRVGGSATQLGSTVTISGGISTNAYYILSLQTTGSNPVACVVKVQRVSDSNWLKSDGTWQAGETACISFDDSDGARITGQGYVGFRSLNTSSGVCRIDDFFAETIVSGATISVSPSTIPAQHAGNISLTVTLSGAATFVNGVTDFTSDNAELVVVSTTVNSTTTATVVVTTGTDTGVCTLTETGTGSAAGALTVADATLSLNPNSGNTNDSLSLDITTTNCVLTQETEVGLFTIQSGGTGASLSNINVTGDNSATCDLDCGTAADTLVIENTSVTNSTANFTVSDGPVTIAVDNSNLFPSPYNWYRSGSTYSLSNTPGAYYRLKFTGTSIKLNLNSPAFTGTSLRVRAIVDGDETYNTAVGNGTTQITLASSLLSGTHELLLYYDANDPTQDVWTTPTMAAKITGFEIDAGASLVSLTPRTKRILWLGDSVSYGIGALRSGTHPTGNKASAAPGILVAEALGAEIGIVGFGSQGYGKTGLGNAPRVYNPSSPSASGWLNYYSGQSRLVTSLLSPAPDYIVCYHGTADYTGSATEGNVEAGVAGLIPALRTAAPSAIIFVIVPANRQFLSYITDGFDAAVGGHSSFSTIGDSVVYRSSDDGNSYLVDLGAELSIGLETNGGGATYAAYDNIHPDTVANGRIASKISAAMLSVISGGSGSGAGGRIVGSGIVGGFAA